MALAASTAEKDPHARPVTEPSTMSDDERRQIRGGAIGRHFGETPGERNFNALDWGAIGYGANTVLSVAVADQARNGKLYEGLNLGNRYITTPVFHRLNGTKELEAGADFHAKLEAETRKYLLSLSGTAHNAQPEDIQRMTPRRIFKKIERLGRREELIEHLKAAAPEFAHIDAHNYWRTAENAVKFLSVRNNAKLFNSFLMLGTGGWILTAPIKILEDHKAGIVRRLDDHYMAHHTLSDGQKAEIEKRHAEINDEAMQSWSSVLASRGAMYPVIMATYMGLGREREANWISRWSPETIDKATHFVGTDTLIENNVNRMSGWLHGERKLFGVDLGKVTAKPMAWLDAKASALPEKTERAWAGTMKPGEPGFRQGREGFVAATGRKRLENVMADTTTEVAYSGIMAGLTFGTSRALAPILGDKHTKARHPAAPANDDLPTAQVASVEHLGRAAGRGASAAR